LLGIEITHFEHLSRKLSLLRCMRNPCVSGVFDESISDLSLVLVAIDNQFVLGHFIASCHVLFDQRILLIGVQTHLSQETLLLNHLGLLLLVLLLLFT